MTQDIHHLSLVSVPSYSLYIICKVSLANVSRARRGCCFLSYATLSHARFLHVTPHEKPDIVSTAVSVCSSLRSKSQTLLRLDFDWTDRFRSDPRRLAIPSAALLSVPTVIVD